MHCSVSSIGAFNIQTIQCYTYSDFTWLKYIGEMEAKSPVLLQLCKAIVSHSDKRNALKHGDAHFPGISTAVSIIIEGEE